MCILLCLWHNDRYTQKLVNVYFVWPRRRTVFPKFDVPAFVRLRFIHYAHIPLTYGISFLRNKRTANCKKDDYKIITRKEGFIGHTMKKNKLRHLVKTGKIEGKILKGR